MWGTMWGQQCSADFFAALSVSLLIDFTLCRVALCGSYGQWLCAAMGAAAAAAVAWLSVTPVVHLSFALVEWVPGSTSLCSL